MNKNGKTFIAVVEPEQIIASVWDPYVYRRNGQSHTLSHFVALHKVSSKAASPQRLPFRPIEYRDLPRGDYLSFMLELSEAGPTTGLPVVGEGTLLFGTMRAYLGNLLITPQAEWVNQSPPLYFQVKSEFIGLAPRDKLVYFWLAYLRSKSFLENLPLGSGGTRPRLQPKALGETPVTVPDLPTRKAIHDQLQNLAKSEWETQSRIIGVMLKVMDAA